MIDTSSIQTDGLTSDITNYHTVSLLSFFFKVLERAIYSQLFHYIMMNTLQDPN